MYIVAIYAIFNLTPHIALFSYNLYGIAKVNDTFKYHKKALMSAKFILADLYSFRRNINEN